MAYPKLCCVHLDNSITDFKPILSNLKTLNSWKLVGLSPSASPFGYSPGTTRFYWRWHIVYYITGYDTRHVVYYTHPCTFSISLWMNRTRHMHDNKYKSSRWQPHNSRHCHHVDSSLVYHDTSSGSAVLYVNTGWPQVTKIITFSFNVWSWHFRKCLAHT